MRQRPFLKFCAIMDILFCKRFHLKTYDKNGNLKHETTLNHSFKQQNNNR